MRNAARIKPDDPGEAWPAANEDIVHFLFAIAAPWRLQGNFSFRKGGLAPKTALARYRPIGSHASCPCIALCQRQFLGHFGAGPKEDLVRRLPNKCRVRHLRVVLVDVKFDHRTNTRHRIQGIQEQPLMLQRTPIGLDERIGEADLDLGKAAFQARTGQVWH